MYSQGGYDYVVYIIFDWFDMAGMEAYRIRY